VILVVGATGSQGGAVVDALLGDGREVAALTRDPESESATALAARGVQVRRGDLDDRASLVAAFEGVDGVFYPSLAPNETARGERVIAAAREAGVPFLVASTGGNCDERPGVPHVDAKADVEDAVRASGVSAAILRPHTFTTNFRMQAAAIREGRLPYPLPEGRTVPLVDPADIGRVAARAFADPERYAGTTTELAAGNYGLGEIADALSAAVGHPVEPEPVDFDVFAERMGAPEVFVRFLEWQTTHEVAPGAVTRRFDIELTDLETALRREWA
jgi:uncharacterized protein YbjT (DUF2867 family)